VKVTLAMGNGGEENLELIERIQKFFHNDYLQKAEDATPLDGIEKPVMTTDSFTISPLFFNGGDIGKLSIAGSCNDLAMMGGRPLFLTFGLIVEEGFELKMLDKILNSMAKELKINGAKVVAGDTKVVPKGSVDGVFINISAIGERQASLSQRNIEEGDVLLVSRDIATHGAAIFAAREGIELDNQIQSDCASLWPVIEELMENVDIKAARDATRGGVAAVLNEWARARGLTMEIDEESIPVSEPVKGICEILGFEPLVLANEGTFVAAVSSKEASRALEILKKHNPNAAIIGKVGTQYPKKAILKSPWGTKRFLDMPSGEILPRIC